VLLLKNTDKFVVERRKLCHHGPHSRAIIGSMTCRKAMAVIYHRKTPINGFIGIFVFNTHEIPKKNDLHVFPARFTEKITSGTLLTPFAAWGSIGRICDDEQLCWRFFLAAILRRYFPLSSYWLLRWYCGWEMWSLKSTGGKTWKALSYTLTYLMSLLSRFFDPRWGRIRRVSTMSQRALHPNYPRTSPQLPPR
jgi:hypothetical protein